MQKQAQEDAQTELNALSPRIPNLVVQIEGAPASDPAITVDGESLSSALIGERRPVNPGRHTVLGVLGSQRVKSDVEVGEGQQKTVVLKLHAVAGKGPASNSIGKPTAGTSAPGKDELTAESNRQSSYRTAGFIGIGAGAAGVAVGAVAGVLAMGKKSDIDKNPNCVANQCLPSERDLVESYNRLRTISTIGFVA
ncbi:MAG TPA: hypothetical protein VGJ84_04455, partial [Polyangiaceae bacterium]